MRSDNSYPEEDPRYQTAKIKEKLNDVSRQAREHIERVNDIQAKVLLKTTADLISGLTCVYDEYESKRNDPWQRA